MFFQFFFKSICKFESLYFWNFLVPSFRNFFNKSKIWCNWILLSIEMYIKSEFVSQIRIILSGKIFENFSPYSTGRSFPFKTLYYTNRLKITFSKSISASHHPTGRNTSLITLRPIFRFIITKIYIERWTRFCKIHNKETSHTFRNTLCFSNYV